MTAQAWVTLIIGVIGFGGVIGGILQRTYADLRAEWWRRAAWAVDHILSEADDATVVGMEVLGRLQESRLAVRADRQMFANWIEPAAIGRDIVDDLSDNGDDASGGVR